MKQIRLSLDPPETDPTLEGWKRERILIQAMMSGEVKPSNSWRPQGFKARIAELNRCISEAEDCQRAKREEDEERREVEMLTHEQRITEFFLRLLYKFTPDDAVRQDIEEKTRKRAEDWEQWKQAEWQKGDDGKYTPKSFRQLADGIQKTLDGYAEMCNTYAKMPTNVRTITERLKEIERQQAIMNADIMTVGKGIRQLCTDKREGTITQAQVASDFKVTTKTVKNWDAGRPNDWGYSKELRENPAMRDKYDECVANKKYYELCKAKAKKEGRIWRYPKTTFIENLHSLKGNRQLSEDDLLNTMIGKMPER